MLLLLHSGADEGYEWLVGSQLDRLICPQDSAALPWSTPNTLSLLAELRPNASTIIAQLANAVPQIVPAAAQPQLTGFPPSTSQNRGTPHPQQVVQSPVHLVPKSSAQARHIVQTENGLPMSSSVAQLPPLQAAATAGKLPSAGKRCSILKIEGIPSL